MTEHDDDFEARPWLFTRLDGTVVVLTVVFWTINALQLSARSLISPSDFNQLDGVVLARLASLGTGIVLTLGMWIILRRLTETRAFAWFWRAAALGLAVCLIHTVLNATYFRLLTDYHVSSDEFFLHPRNVISTYISFLWPIMTWSALCAVMVAGDNLRRQQARTAEAQAAAQQAQLAALRLQIQPHFLFNTLNSVSSLISQGRAEEADRTLVRLADFLKHTLAAAPRELVRLENEIDSQGRYLDIEEIRFPDRLRRRLRLEPEAMKAMVPSLILQPFVENAVKHGLAQSLSPVMLEVGARRDGERLKLWVADDGPGPAAACTSGLGRSLANAGRRLHLLYGPDASLRYGPGAEGGWRVDVELPFEVAA
ncbi:sensor histidine kinase [Brevundimonas phoenicis]|uniref:sensor histidine kinase n=1 Tax=unclassified Brevundimonas TaxID=2622653 RepID=UPI00399F6DD0